MKTLLFTLIAIITLASCTKDEPLTVEQPQDQKDSVMVESWEEETQVQFVEF